MKEFRGNAVLVHFWASWCPPCLDELPTVVQLAQDLKNKPFRVVAISLDSSWADAQKVLPQSSVPSNMVSLLDTKQEVSDRYGSYQFPESYLLNTRGEVAAKLVGGQKWDSPMVRAALDRLMLP